MKSGIHKINHAGPRQQAKRRIAITTFQYHHPTAVRIAVAGTFNDWRPGASPMVALGDGRWLKALVLPPGVYEYRLVVDGEWIPDPQAKEAVPNPFGGFNSIHRVPQWNGTTKTR